MRPIAVAVALMILFTARGSPLSCPAALYRFTVPWTPGGFGSCCYSTIPTLTLSTPGMGFPKVYHVRTMCHENEWRSTPNRRSIITLVLLFAFQVTYPETTPLHIVLIATSLYDYKRS